LALDRLTAAPWSPRRVLSSIPYNVGMDQIRWGILSTGRIAGRLAETLRTLEGAELLAVGSRSQASAEAFGERYGIPRRYGSYQELVADPDLDVIYVASPHSHHYAHTLLALEAGKHALVEKSFAHNAAEARRMIEKARGKKLFLMEAMWTRFLPHMVRLRELLQEGVIGEVRLIQASMGFRAPVAPESRLLNPELAGGALLDVGVYPVSFTSMVWGKPERLDSQVYLGPTGVDLQETLLLGYPDGRLATLVSSLHTPTHVAAYLYGTEGYIEIPSPWYRARSLVLHKNGHAETLECPYEGHGDGFQALETMRCIRAGKLESAVMPLGETLEIMQTLDAFRQGWGLVYPNELRD